MEKLQYDLNDQKNQIIAEYNGLTKKYNTIEREKNFLREKNDELQKSKTLPQLKDGRKQFHRRIKRKSRILLSLFAILETLTVIFSVLLTVMTNLVPVGIITTLLLTGFSGYKLKKKYDEITKKDKSILKVIEGKIKKIEDNSRQIEQMEQELLDISIKLQQSDKSLDEILDKISKERETKQRSSQFVQSQDIEQFNQLFQNGQIAFVFRKTPRGETDISISELTQEDNAKIHELSLARGNRKK